MSSLLTTRLTKSEQGWHNPSKGGIIYIYIYIYIIYNTFQRDIRDCNVLCFTETLLTGETLSDAVQPTGFSTHRADRNRHLSGKKRGGGVCFMVNVTWCDHNNTQVLKSFCSPDLEFITIKCRPHYLPREFSRL